MWTSIHLLKQITKVTKKKKGQTKKKYLKHVKWGRHPWKKSILIWQAIFLNIYNNRASEMFTSVSFVIANKIKIYIQDGLSYVIHHTYAAIKNVREKIHYKPSQCLLYFSMKKLFSKGNYNLNPQKGLETKFPLWSGKSVEHESSYMSSGPKSQRILL